MSPYKSTGKFIRNIHNFTGFQLNNGVNVRILMSWLCVDPPSFWGQEGGGAQAFSQRGQRKGVSDTVGWASPSRSTWFLAQLTALQMGWSYWLSKSQNEFIFKIIYLWRTIFHWVRSHSLIIRPFLILWALPSPFTPPLLLLLTLFYK